jgi:hypothetical protein
MMQGELCSIGVAIEAIHFRGGAGCAGKECIQQFFGLAAKLVEIRPLWQPASR